MVRHAPSHAKIVWFQTSPGFVWVGRVAAVLRIERSFAISAQRARRGRAAPSPSSETSAPTGQSRRRPATTPPPEPTGPGQWYRVDLHLHTPASSDYQQPRTSLLELLRRAEEQELDIIAFTDHNSVRGYAELWREIEDLELLEHLKRLDPTEAERLAEYRRLLSKLLLLPGFEFTATFGFHILAIFPERTSVRMMEHLLLLLGVPEAKFGSGEVGATTDVLRTYEILADHGALVIGAHVNSTHGIAMQGLRFGGQTKIAYTQDPNLHALEVTDLALGPHRRSTARFFNGTKPEYPRRMHAIQGSDAHRLERDPERETNLGIGDRATAMFLPERSFAAIKALLQSTDFELTQPAVSRPADPVLAARVAGNTATQVFHESLSTKRTGLGHILRDVVGLANAEGGTIYVGLSASEKRPVAGVDADAAAQFARALAEQVTPVPPVAVETVESDGKPVLVITVERGSEQPYALLPGTIYVRRETESVVASRDEIVAMVRSVALAAPAPAAAAVPPDAPAPATPPAAAAVAPPAAEVPGPAPGENGTGRRERRPTASRGVRPRLEAAPDDDMAAPLTDPDAALAIAPALVDGPPRLEMIEEPMPVDPIAPTTGVELLDAYEQDGVAYFTVHDLRDHKLIHNVPADTDRRLWRAAIATRAEHELDLGSIDWRGNYGLWRSYRPRGGERRYNLVYRGGNELRVFYGVTEAGMDQYWRAVLAEPVAH